MRRAGTYFNGGAVAWVLALSALLTLGAPAWAERADRTQPMNIEADALRYDEAQQTSVFTGNVVITKGSIVIRGQQITVRQGPTGHQFGTALGAPGQPAYFRQKREGVDESLEGLAQRIEYNSEADTIRFIGQAELRRYRGATLSDRTVGSVIAYDNRTDVFTVDGGPASQTPENPTGRVRAVLSPQAAPSPTPAPPTPLQPSSRLEPRR